MRANRPLLTFATALALTGALQARGSFYIESCSLACSDGSTGSQIFCSTVNTFEDAPLSFTFSEPVDFSTVSAASLRVVNVQTGAIPEGTFELGPGGRTLIFRPRLTFDINGAAIYSLAPNTAYQITIGGSAQADSGPLIRSTLGNANLARLQCTIFTDLGRLGPIRVVCETSPNSVGTGALLGWAGGSSLALANLGLSAFSAPPNKMGMYFVGTRIVDLPLGQGVRCVGGNLARLTPPNPTDATGNAPRLVDLSTLPAAVGGVSAGTTLYLQYWYRDGADSNLTNALEVTAFP